MVAAALLGDATTVPGALGAVTTCGVTELLGSENWLVPNELLAETSHWYETPSVSPVTVAVVGTKVDPAGALTVTSGTVSPFDENELCTV
jgi:hypothetical protein